MYQSIDPIQQSQPDIEEVSTEAFVSLTTKKRSSNVSALLVIGLLSVLFIGVSLSGRFQFTGLTAPATLSAAQGGVSTALYVSADDDTTTDDDSNPNDATAPLLGKAKRFGTNRKGDIINYMCIKYKGLGYNWNRDSLLAADQTRLYFDGLGDLKIVDIVLPIEGASSSTKIKETYDFKVAADQVYFRPNGALTIYRGDNDTATEVFTTDEFGEGFWYLTGSARDGTVPGSLSFYGKYHKGVPSYTVPASSATNMANWLFASRLKKCGFKLDE